MDQVTSGFTRRNSRLRSKLTSSLLHVVVKCCLQGTEVRALQLPVKGINSLCIPITFYKGKDFKGGAVEDAMRRGCSTFKDITNFKLLCTESVCIDKKGVCSCKWSTKEDENK
ncbi:hypothetical protein DV515_00010873 [Chloebia gouldiae]|uniref:Uncharacterized protein n=1 Tax=Chloebia gouldiae TaxID=44316 RepID=A0A3L8S7Y3_CHLGU|nr:hypothetical protein DV515_00010873 [Chloebia gouldiae]